MSFSLDPYLPPQICPGPLRQTTWLQTFLLCPYRQSSVSPVEGGQEEESDMARRESTVRRRTRNTSILLPGPVQLK